jgi:hypothetical protein
VRRSQTPEIFRNSSSYITRPGFMPLSAASKDRIHRR